MTFEGSIANRAVEAWIATFPIEDRLVAFVDGLQPAIRSDVTAAAKALLADAEAFLDRWKAPIGMEGLAVFHAALQPYLLHRHPWMGDEAWRAMRSYTSWYIWHEGY